MRKTIITIIILILGLAYAVQDERTIQVFNPQLSGTDLTIPKSINFQGYLYRDGNPMDTTMTMWFGIYDAQSSGTQLFQQTVSNVLVTKGWFTVSLDNIPNSVFPVAGPTRYLEVKAPSTGPSLSPRISLVSVGYSYHAITADSAEYAKAAPLTRPITPPVYSDEIRDTTVTSAKIKDGAITMPKINQSGASTGQVIKWTGTAWAPRNDSTAPPTGPAGGDLTGTYPNPTIANNAVNSTKILDGSIRGIDITKPCSLEASVVYPNALFLAKNNGNGNGIEVTNAGTDGFRVVRAGDDGVQVDSAGYGYSLYRAANDGIWISRAKRYGLYVDSAGQAGINVKVSGHNGVEIDSADWTGVSVGKARFGFSAGDIIQEAISVGQAGMGMYVGNTDYDGIEINQTGTDGFSVYNAGDDGLYVRKANSDGIQIDTATATGVYVRRTLGWNGFHVEKAHAWGFVVDSAGQDGLKVGLAAGKGVSVGIADADGFSVDQVDNGNGLHVGFSYYDGVHIDSTNWAGFYVQSAGNCGVTVNQAHADGIRVYHAGTDGVYIGRASTNGIYVDSAGNDGVYIDSATNNGVWVNHSNDAGVYAQGNNYAGYFVGNFVVTGGVKSAAVKVGEGDYRLLYCQESPEVWFEDAGEGQLTNGKAHIELEPIFLKTVTISEQYPIKVFAQLTSGNPMGVVIKKGVTGFDVIAENPTSNATFDYRVMAKRKGFENLRMKKMEPGTNPEELVAKQAKMRTEEKERRQNEKR